jgi:SPX domain protein involved in polyphosphate accumulation
MKFGDQLFYNKIPEWSEHYIDYNGIKKAINSLKKQNESCIKIT